MTPDQHGDMAPLDDYADRLRRIHLKLSGVTSAPDWPQLQESEQVRWRTFAGEASAAYEAISGAAAAIGARL